MLSEAGTPQIAGALAWIDCDISQELDGGDHFIVIARVVRMDTGLGDPSYSTRVASVATGNPASPDSWGTCSSLWLLRTQHSTTLRARPPRAV
jgi:flavin reductase (DIM6/NTAB) family NADH-FMN oxidoreductase RutF